MRFGLLFVAAAAAAAAGYAAGFPLLASLLFELVTWYRVL